MTQEELLQAINDSGAESVQASEAKLQALQAQFDAVNAQIAAQA